jgi:pimeloyl-ACP methyl ester carboxylesterase
MTESKNLFRAGNGEPLVLIHPAEASWHAWRPVLEPLTRQYEVHAVTLPGHLDAAPLAGPVSIDTFADAVEAYLDQAGLATAHFAGNSLGGILAVEMVRRGRARSAVSFSGPSAAVDDRALTRLYRQFQIGALLGRIPGLARLGGRTPASRRRFLSSIMVHGERMTSAEYAQFLAAGRAANVATELVRDFRRGPSPAPFHTDLPVTIAWGSEDRVVPLESFGRPSHALVNGSKLSLIDGAGHIPMWDNPSAVVQTIQKATAQAVGIA